MIQPHYWIGVDGHLHTLATLPTGIEPLSDLGYYGEDLNLFSLLGNEA
jgi:hypothetical protein